MTELIFIKNLNQVPSLPTGWENPTLSVHPQIITPEGKKISSDSDFYHNIGRKYQVVAKHIIQYSFCERIARIFKGIFTIICTFGCALVNKKSRKDLYQLFFEKIKISKTFARRYDYNDCLEVNSSELAMQFSYKTSEMIEFLESDPSFELFKLRCKETGFVINSDEWWMVFRVKELSKLLLAIASVSDKNILPYFLAKNRSKGAFNIKTPLLKNVLLNYLHSIQNSSLDIENPRDKIKLLIESGAELNPEATSIDNDDFQFHTPEPVLSFFLNRLFANVKICSIENDVTSGKVFGSNVVPIIHLYSTIGPLVHFLLTNKAKTIKEKFPNDDLSFLVRKSRYSVKDVFLTTIFVDSFRHENFVFNFLQAGKSDPGSGFYNFNNDVLEMIIKIFIELGVSSSALTSKYPGSEFTSKLERAQKKANYWRDFTSALLIGGKQSLIKET